MTAPETRPAQQERDGLRVIGLPPPSEREQTEPDTFPELKERQRDLQEQMLALVAFDPHLVEQLNLLLDQAHLNRNGFARRARLEANEKWERRLEHRVAMAEAQARRTALEDWVHAAHPDEAIDQAAGRLVALVLGWSGDSGKAARRALEALANLEGAWHAWAVTHGLPVPDPTEGLSTEEEMGGEES